MKLNKTTRRAAAYFSVIFGGFTTYILGALIEKINPKDTSPLSMLCFASILGLISVVMGCLALLSEEAGGQ